MVNWIIVGAQTGQKAVPPEKKWVQDIIDFARSTDTPLFLKGNLHWHEKIQEYPKTQRRY
jgi:protein gp37